MNNQNKSEMAAEPPDNSLYGGSIPLTEQESDNPGIKLYSSEELAGMPARDLLDHTLNLQEAYSRLESENRFLSWEFREFQDNYTYFSRAAKLAHRLNASDVDTVASLAVNEIPEYFNCRFACLFFYDQESCLLRLYRASGPHPQLPSLHRVHDAGHIIVELFFRQSEPFLVEYVAETGEVFSDDNRIRATVPEIWVKLLGEKALVFPLHVKRPGCQEPLVLGGLIIGDSRIGLQESDAEVSIVFADLLSSSLYNARLVQKLNELTIIDPLTQVYNRRHLMSQLAAAMIQARRHGHALSVVMLDIDEFKRFNDTYGHLCGDEVLKEVGTMIKDSIRQDVDIPARFGGEEFLIIMPYTGIEEAMRAAERIREKIKRHVFAYEHLPLSVTCSLGAAEFDQQETLEHFIERVDTALYVAKKRGRDQVCVYRSDAEP